MPNKVIKCQNLPRCYPFVKWAGGKRQLLSKIETLIPAEFDRYFEPFLGGGALFFYLSSQKNLRFDAFLSDINYDLINCYLIIRDSVNQLIGLLEYHQEQYKLSPKNYYYNSEVIRNRIIVQIMAARFITLNKTCFNGLYRVNKKKMFNAPMGKYTNPLICDSENLSNVNILLRELRPHLVVEDYKKALD